MLRGALVSLLFVGFALGLSPEAMKKYNMYRTALEAAEKGEPIPSPEKESVPSPSNAGPNPNSPPQPVADPAPGGEVRKNQVSSMKMDIIQT